MRRGTSVTVTVTKLHLCTHTQALGKGLPGNTFQKPYVCLHNLTGCYQVTTDKVTCVSRPNKHFGGCMHVGQVARRRMGACSLARTWMAKHSDATILNQSVC